MDFNIEAEIQKRLIEVKEIELPTEPADEKDLIVGVAVMLETHKAYTASQKIERQLLELQTGFSQLHDEFLRTSANIEKDLKELNEHFQNHLFVFSEMKKYLNRCCKLETYIRVNPPFNIRSGWCIVCKDDKKEDTEYLPIGFITSRLQ